VAPRNDGSRPPERLDALLEGELGHLGTQPPVPLPLIKAWAAAVGELVARNSRPSRIKGKTLIVKVTTSTWMSEVQLLSGTILARLRDRRDLPLIEELRFELGELPAMGPGHGARAEQPPRPRRATTGRPLPDPIARALAGVDNTELRGRIEGVLGRVLEDDDDR
jgi:hypothetical protein